MTPLPAPSLPDRLRAHAHLHPESADLLREAADRTDQDGMAIVALVERIERILDQLGAP